MPHITFLLSSIRKPYEINPKTATRNRPTRTNTRGTLLATRLKARGGFCVPNKAQPHTDTHTHQHKLTPGLRDTAREQSTLTGLAKKGRERRPKRKLFPLSFLVHHISVPIPVPLRTETTLRGHRFPRLRTRSHPCVSLLSRSLPAFHPWRFSSVVCGVVRTMSTKNVCAHPVPR